MLRTILASTFVVLVTAAGAQEWMYEDRGVPIAYFDNGDAQLQFACRGGDLAMGFWVRVPDPQVAAAPAMSLAITPDPGTDGSAPAGSSFVQDIPLIHSDGTSMVVRGPVARRWASIAQRAKDVIRVAYLRTNVQGEFEVFDSNVFGAKGSAVAIKNVLELCG